MELRPKVLKCFVLCGFLLALFPPWSVREQSMHSTRFAPPYSYRHAPVFNPPSSYSASSERSFAFSGRTVQIDFTRLLTQYVALGFLAAFTSVRWGKPKSKQASKNQDLPQGRLPTFRAITTLAKKQNGQPDLLIDGQLNPRRDADPVDPSLRVEKPFCETHLSTFRSMLDIFKNPKQYSGRVDGGEASLERQKDAAEANGGAGLFVVLTALCIACFVSLESVMEIQSIRAKKSAFTGDLIGSFAIYLTVGLVVGGGAKKMFNSKAAVRISIIVGSLAFLGVVEIGQYRIKSSAAAADQPTQTTRLDLKIDRPLLMADERSIQKTKTGVQAFKDRPDQQLAGESLQAHRVNFSDSIQGNISSAAVESQVDFLQFSPFSLEFAVAYVQGGASLSTVRTLYPRREYLSDREFETLLWDSLRNLIIGYVVDPDKPQAAV